MNLPMQTTYRGRVLDQWELTQDTYGLELMVGSERLVFHGSQVSLKNLEKGTLLELIASSSGEIAQFFKLASPMGTSRSDLADSMRWRGKLGVLSRMQKLHQRQEILREVREDLYLNHFLEVETPLVVKGTCPDTHIETIQTQPACEGDSQGYLVTSTEYQIKRMIVGGFEKVFTLTRNFRANDRGRYHSTEFTMLEWARAFGKLDEIEEDAIRFIRRAFQKIYPAGSSLVYGNSKIEFIDKPWERLTVREGFRKHLGIKNVADFSLTALLKGAEQANIAIPENFKTDPHLVLSFLLDRLQPFLGHQTPTFLREWPAFMTTSAQVSTDDPFVAERSELYIAGIEIADGFPFLRDPNDQRTFFNREVLRRKEEGKVSVVLDEKYIEALEEGIPPGAGMALGVDRLVMILTQSEALAEVQAFSWEEL